MGQPLFFERLGKEALGQKADVLGKHGEQATHEELRDQGCIVAVVFQLLGQVRQVACEVFVAFHQSRQGVEAQATLSRKGEGQLGASSESLTGVPTFGRG